MKYRITLDIKNTLESDDHKLHVQANHEYIDVCSLLYLEEIFLAIFKSCKKADRKAFYSAFAKFAEEDFDDAKQFIEEEMRHEN